MEKSKGLRPKPEILKVQTWADAEAVLAQIADNELGAAQLKKAADARMLPIREDLKKDLDSIEETSGPLREALEAFTREHKEEMLPLKSKTLRFGRVGLRDEPKFSWPKGNDVLVRRLKELRLKDYVIVEECPDKNGIKAHWEELPLKDLGVKRVVKTDVFYIDLKTE